MKKIIIRNN